MSARDVDALADLVDPGVDNGRWGSGRAGVKAYYSEFFERDYRHAFSGVGTHQVDLVADHTARGICFTGAWSGRPDARGWSDTLVVSFDAYQKTDDRWGFVHGRETLHHLTDQAHEDAVIPGLTDGAKGSSPGRAIPRVWEYSARWRDKTAGSAPDVRG